MDEALIGIDHLLEVYRLVYIVREGCLAVEVLVCCGNVTTYGTVAWELDNACGEDAPGEIAAIRDEVYGGIKVALHMAEALLDFRHMLVFECFIDAHVTHAPRKMGGGRGFLSRSR